MSLVVGLLSPGDMGSAVGKRIADHGGRVVTCLEGRSARTKGLAEAAGIDAVDSFESLVKTSDLVISILVPSESSRAASRVVAAIEQIGKGIPYTDCNAIAPSTAKTIAETIKSAGGNPIDAGIIGGPPIGESPNTRFYASGPHADPFVELNQYGLDVRVIGDEIGQASGLKMCYAASTKGTSALMLNLLIVAKRLNLYDALIAEFEMSQRARLTSLSGLNGVPSKSRRWIGEMEEIAKTFDEAGLTPYMFRGAAEVFRLVGGSSVADETPEDQDQNRTVEALIEMLSAEE